MRWKFKLFICNLFEKKSGEKPEREKVQTDDSLIIKTAMGIVPGTDAVFF